MIEEVPQHTAAHEPRLICASMSRSCLQRCESVSVSVYYVAVRTIVLSRHGSNLARPVINHDIIHSLHIVDFLGSRQKKLRLDNLTCTILDVHRVQWCYWNLWLWERIYIAMYDDKCRFITNNVRAESFKWPFTMFSWINIRNIYFWI